MKKLTHIRTRRDFSRYFELLFSVLCIGVCASTAFAQVDSGSNGSDGPFNPITNTNIDMADHPDGIYHYTSVNIPLGVTVSFTPNANNTPVVWLVQESCVILGTVSVAGQPATGISGTGTTWHVNPAAGLGGPGGCKGGAPAAEGLLAGSGLGPGGGAGGSGIPGNASFGTVGDQTQSDLEGRRQNDPGPIYGNGFLLPLLGGSGGGGPGAGGGGAILIASSGNIIVSGTIEANGGYGSSRDVQWIYYYWFGGGGGGSGGAIRLVSTSVSGAGALNVKGGQGYAGSEWSSQAGSIPFHNTAGSGRIRIDALSDTFGGHFSDGASYSRGNQRIIILPQSQNPTLAIQSVAGAAVVANPTGSLTTPDVVVSANQQNPIAIVVRCANIPLNTDVIIEVKPANGATVRAVGLNTTGTQASSTATVSLNMPRGGGTIQAKAVSGIADTLSASLNTGQKYRSYARTGLTADGERFAKVEVTATLKGQQQIAYLTESGRRYSVPTR